jgi:hypothetical protein
VRAPLPAAERAREMLAKLEQRHGPRGALVRPRDAPPAVVQQPLAVDAPIVAARTPEAVPMAHAPALAPPVIVSRELAELRAEFGRVLVVVGEAVERNDVAALLEALDAIEAVRAREVRLVTITIGDSWRDNSEPLSVAQHIGSALGVLSRAVESVRRGTW